MATVKIKSTLFCPYCEKETTESMPENSCLYFWECPHCERVLKPKEGDCCVFCSYGDTDCPPKQKSGACC